MWLLGLRAGSQRKMRNKRDAQSARRQALYDEKRMRIRVKQNVEEEERYLKERYLRKRDADERMFRQLFKKVTDLYLFASTWSNDCLVASVLNCSVLDCEKSGARRRNCTLSERSVCRSDGTMWRASTAIRSLIEEYSLAELTAYCRLPWLASKRQSSLAIGAWRRGHREWYVAFTPECLAALTKPSQALGKLEKGMKENLYEQLQQLRSQIDGEGRLYYEEQPAQIEERLRRMNAVGGRMPTLLLC